MSRERPNFKLCNVCKESKSNKECEHCGQNGICIYCALYRLCCMKQGLIEPYGVFKDLTNFQYRYKCDHS
jgi:hypothetical protein